MKYTFKNNKYGIAEEKAEKAMKFICKKLCLFRHWKETYLFYRSKHNKNDYFHIELSNIHSNNVISFGISCVDYITDASTLKAMEKYLILIENYCRMFDKGELK